MLTGGTGDVKPQLLTHTFAQSANDTATTETVPLPVMRNFSGPSGKRAQIVELLKIYMHYGSALPEVDANYSAHFMTKNPGAAVAAVQGDASIIASFGWQSALTTSGMYVHPKNDVIDLTDGAGNGVLVAVDNLFISQVSNASGTQNSNACRILYRVYSADVTEYIGIVQSQQ
jgi:hypothetical protein